MDGVAERAVLPLMVHEIVKQFDENQVRLSALVRKSRRKCSILDPNIEADFDDLRAATERERELPFLVVALALFKH